MALITVEQDGKQLRTTSSFFRGDNTNFYPNETSFDQENIVSDYIVKGWMPTTPFVTKETPIAAFGSCFAKNISNYLHERGFNVLTKSENGAYVTQMGEGMVNTFAIRQQFEWAWLGKTPSVDLWHGYSAEAFGYDESVRQDTKKIFDQVDVFVITLGLSEIWYDEPTGEVFWRAVPLKDYDPTRHKFRVSSVAENLENLRAIHRLIRTHRPDASIIFTVSPIPLQATFRDVSCLSANAVSKSILRVAIDELYRELHHDDPKLFYFPSYEVVMYLFNNAWTVDRRHVKPRVLRFNMEIFERYFCESELDDAALLEAFRDTLRIDIVSGTDAARSRRRALADAKQDAADKHDSPPIQRR
ncbi:MAG TPA: GSCFA domain-containing protein [Alphaproteobacteria bacterium]|jgi:hypothetical protein|nr:GSCFA domain-containing protein [Alphaproteobacteria bacterium]